MATKKNPPEKSPAPAAKAPGPSSAPAKPAKSAAAPGSPRPPEAPAPAEAPVRQLVQRLPVAPGLGHLADLPQVKAPSLANLDIRVPQGEDLTEEDLLERFHELARAKAESRPRAEGEALAMGDDVCLDILGYANGRLIPLSTRVGFWMELAPQLMLPGFAEVIAEASVGDSVEVGLVLPDGLGVAVGSALPLGLGAGDGIAPLPSAIFRTLRKRSSAALPISVRSRFSPGRETTMLRSPSVTTSASATP